jgi:hypothetical protein
MSDDKWTLLTFLRDLRDSYGGPDFATLGPGDLDAALADVKPPASNLRGRRRVE